MDRYNQLFQEIFKQPLSHEASVNLLEKTISNYPYFTPAHFFLLHLTGKSSDAFANRAKKTALSFNNNYWLNFQLLELNSIASKQDVESKASVADTEQVSKDLLNLQTPAEVGERTDESPGVTGNATAEPALQTPDIAAAGDLPLEENASPATGNNAKPSDFEEVLLTATAPVAETIITPEGVEEQLVNNAEISQQPAENTFSETFTSAIKEELPFETAGALPPVGAFASRNSVAEPVLNESHTEEVITNDSDNTQAFLSKEIPADERTSAASAFPAEELPVYTEAEMAENEAAYNETDLPPGDNEDKSMDHVSLKMADTLAGINLDKSTTEDTISFEPLHASDYFASVGIKLSEEVKPADKLGLQLKSFTEWLKTMKKVHAEQLAETSSSDSILEKNDKKIQELAEASNKENEVLTEAMADVFQQQGKTAKAIEVYEKLSLLNPSKMVYFAAKIKQLKD